MAGELQTVKVYKSFGGRTAKQQFSNVYHVTAEAPLPDALWTPFVTALVSAESQLHGSMVHIMRVVISDFAAQPEYDPKKLRVWEVNGQGQRGISGEAIYLPLDLALKCKKVVGYGRSGTCFFRGVLNSTDVTQGAGGDYTLKAGVPEGLNNLTNNIVSMTAASLDAMTGEMVMPPRVNAEVGGIQMEARIVQNIFCSGISVNRRDHRYFDTLQSDDGVGVGT